LYEEEVKITIEIVMKEQWKVTWLELEWKIVSQMMRMTLKGKKLSPRTRKKKSNSRQLGLSYANIAVLSEVPIAPVNPKFSFGDVKTYFLYMNITICWDAKLLSNKVKPHQCFYSL